MNWKNLSYSLRGGIISVLIVLILSGIALILSLLSNGAGAWGIVFLVPGLIALLPFILSNLPSWVAVAIGIFVSLIAWFLVGALIGWIIGKIKFKSKN